MAEDTAARHTPDWRTDSEIRDEHDRLATIYRQRGLSTLIDTASDEIVKLRRARAEMAEALDELLSAFDDAIRRYDAGDGRAIQSNMLSATAKQARALIARLERQ